MLAGHGRPFALRSDGNNYLNVGECWLLDAEPIPVDAVLDSLSNFEIH
jgi:hypothetical protein